MDSKIANTIFRYDTETGKLYWKIKPCRKVAIGAEIKTKNSCGYFQVMYKGKRYLAHRIIWLICYGKFPDGDIDHIDHNPQNNKLDNLRDVSHSSNLRNQSISSRNTSGIVGVSFYKRYNKWQADGRTSDGISKYLGRFDKIEDAIAAREAFNRENGYHPNHGKQ